MTRCRSFSLRSLRSHARRVLGVFLAVSTVQGCVKWVAETRSVPEALSALRDEPVLLTTANGTRIEVTDPVVIHDSVFAFARSGQTEQRFAVPLADVTAV